MRLVIIPFGEWNGTPIAELPDYVLYQLVNRRLRPDLAAEVGTELTRRAVVRRRRTTRRAA
jgi:hypothetical protein